MPDWYATEYLNKGYELDTKGSWEQFVQDVPPEEQAVNRYAFRRLLDGVAPSATEVAKATGKSLNETRSFLEIMVANGSATREGDRVTGAGGVTITPTMHMLKLDGRTLYCWCALDTLGIPAALDKDCVIESVDASTGAKVELRLESGHLAEAPSGLELELVPPDQARLLCGDT